MSYDLIFTPRAMADLLEIKGYIAVDNPSRAQSYVRELWEEIQSLKSLPARCPIAPESSAGVHEIRHLLFGDYRILFVVKVKNVHILRVVHGARVSFKVESI
ncbi:MAG: type II toxin-antitoxin system RelE/ParE family toxin [Alphaproteobacteria bacterium]|nr:type II toxin-antitoxin system RelE/ParE family toxin [Alphaproteobacteria bacterium]